MKKRIVIIGGCAAGPKVAAKSRRMNQETDILLFAKGNMISYSACGMPYFIKGDIKDFNQLIIRTPDDFRAKGIKVFLNHECSEILPSEKQVIINGRYINYDELVLAIGANSFIPQIKNINLENVFHLRIIEDGIKIKESMKNSKKVLIVGFGYIGLEMAEAFISNGIKVCIIESQKHIMSFLDSEISDLIEKHIKKMNYGDYIEIIKDDIVEEFIGDKKFSAARTKKGKYIEADMCLLAIGVKPNTEIAKKAGIKIGTTGGITVNEKMQTNIEHIWAVGDCCEKHCYVTDMPTYCALGSIANKEGRVCAINLNGEEENFYGVLGSAITKYFDYTISITGITEKRANEVKEKIGIEPVSTIITKHDKASYIPNSKEITIKIVADKKTGRILGAQGLGVGDVDKRISIITSAIQNKMTVQELMHLDLGYMPKTSGTIDPILTACYKLQDIIKDN